MGRCRGRYRPPAPVVPVPGLRARDGPGMCPAGHRRVLVLHRAVVRPSTVPVRRGSEGRGRGPREGRRPSLPPRQAARPARLSERQRGVPRAGPCGDRGPLLCDPGGGPRPGHPAYRQREPRHHRPPSGGIGRSPVRDHQVPHTRGRGCVRDGDGRPGGGPGQQPQGRARGGAGGDPGGERPRSGQGSGYSGTASRAELRLRSGR